MLADMKTVQGHERLDLRPYTESFKRATRIEVSANELQPIRAALDSRGTCGFDHD